MKDKSMSLKRRQNPYDKRVVFLNNYWPFKLFSINNTLSHFNFKAF